MKMRIPVFAFLLFTFPFLLSPLFLRAQSPNWDSVYADYFTKYSPVDTPAWLFPICFKNYIGEWDTLYLGHDNNGMGLNVEFGEGWITLDTSIFNVGLGIQGDSGVKVAINKINVDGFSIGFTKAPPLTMYWNNNLFYSDDLPFPDLSPLPRARGELWCQDADFQFPTCPLSSPLYMSDSSFNHTFLRMDSIFFDGDGSSAAFITMQLYIVPFDESIDGIDENADSPLISVFPNPANSWINIKSAFSGFTLTIVDVLGKEIKNLGTFNNEENSIDVSFLPEGIYFLKGYYEHKSYFTKIIKISNK